MKDRDVEAAVRQVYDFCPPTVTRYSDEGRAAYKQAWAAFITALDLGPDRLPGRRLLDVGCGSAEKATFYHDWGAQVTGIDMTPAVLERAKETIGDRPIRLIHSSLFDLALNERFDVVVSDGVLHHTANTLNGLRWCVEHLEPEGQLMFALVNVWGSFWWFKPARAVTYALGGRDYHARARWGQRLFARLRGGQEGSEQNSFFRSTQSWAYDWFGNPRWSAHSPGEIRRWLDELNLDYVASVPSLMVKRPPATWYQRLFRRVSGDGPMGMAWYWLLCGEPNMVYVTARKRV
jgi:2-polyprenyl-3-methyl-5-hydroxy-6-metoxy-1,4-benzoquinol methylase